MKISAVIPTINEAETIGAVINGLKSIENIEIIVVDSNSNDGTPDIARSLGATVINEPRKGYGRAYKTGIERASGDIIVCLDGDNTYPYKMVRPLIDILLIDNVDFISCDRMTLRSKSNYTSLHRFGNMVLNLSIKLLFNFSLKDSQSGMWVFKKDLYNKMGYLGDGMSFSEDIKIEAIRHGKLIEIPIVYGVRLSRPKLRTWEDGFKNLFHLFVKRVRV
ncbi:glycosyltransferase family 2 protein [Picrophilus oshimae]|uniref:Glycosyltransferase n=1 Tax=Picrophilus torridus (strain ATCC 700027 / DSM 9790 / JCM 10055 / NBRC 100828 / KAW 2/3) TaxID=1122961 RepID=Q6KZC4_PICTO|nr:glycosyltransferase family 2 protein [Picrophilus oshimae]AAT43928.1 glycosyltransferase [Picrophilus oshimae DSM 9789]SMD30999.1 hypothetical protein SAMN02745355_0917 [Picrophilus oshimae DSM 9789]